MLWEKIYHDVSSVDDATCLFKVISDFAVQCGFDYCSYSINIPAINSKSRFFLFDNCPAKWSEDYRTNQTHENDPVIRKGMKSNQPVIWSEAVFVDAAPLWLKARQSGLNIGISVPCWSAFGVFGMLSFMRREKPIGDEEQQALSTKMQVMASLIHLSMYQLLEVEKITGMQDVALTAREREIMLWTSEGKTAEVIGDILNISTRTVNFHISNVLTKLMAVNKVQAVMKARTLGLL
ncbi:LuxR family transcriptional regulator [Brucellaceae bacterium C25G]